MKEKYKDILVALDGSEQSFNALEEAVEVARRNNGKLHVITVKDTQGVYGVVGPTTFELADTDFIAQKIIRDATKIIDDLVPYETDIIAGSPKRRIVSFAEAQDIDLIIIGFSGAGMIDKILVGSTTTYVVSHAPCNVMVVR
jgi:nucleotide-binding universal stress UspA family protein